MSIDPLGEQPVYLQVAELLRRQILSGKLEPRTFAPSAKQLQQEHGIARGTATKALHVLVAEGYLSVVPGKGFVVKPR